MGVEAINSLEDFNTVINSDTPALIDFWAAWCGPCKVISPVFEKFSEQFQGVKFYKVDVDAQTKISEKVGIRAMPTFMLYKNGEEKGKLVGAAPPSLLELAMKAQSLIGTTSSNVAADSGAKAQSLVESTEDSESPDTPSSTSVAPDLEEGRVA